MSCVISGESCFQEEPFLCRTFIVSLYLYLKIIQLFDYIQIFQYFLVLSIFSIFNIHIIFIHFFHWEKTILIISQIAFHDIIFIDLLDIQLFLEYEIYIYIHRCMYIYLYYLSIYRYYTILFIDTIHRYLCIDTQITFYEGIKLDTNSQQCCILSFCTQNNSVVYDPYLTAAQEMLFVFDF